jgi:hypothetical protein
MEVLLLGLTKLLASSGFGTIFGGLMGYANRKADLEYKKLEYQDKEKQRAHEIEQRRIDADIMEREYYAKVQIAEIEGEATVEAAAYKSLEKSYEFAKPEPGSKMAAFSSFVRPFISLAYFLVSSITAGFILYYSLTIEYVRYDHAQLYELMNFVISWIFFMSGSCIGYWFSVRAGKPPSMK